MTDSLPEFDPTAKPIWEEFEEITKDIPKEELDKLVPDRTSEIWFIGIPRQDGTAPSIEKARNDGFYLKKEDADEAAELCFHESMPYRSFKATVTVKRHQ